MATAVNPFEQVHSALVDSLTLAEQERLTALNREYKRTLPSPAVRSLAKLTLTETKTLRHEVVALEDERIAWVDYSSVGTLFIVAPDAVELFKAVDEARFDDRKVELLDVELMAVFYHVFGGLVTEFVR